MILSAVFLSKATILCVSSSTPMINLPPSVFANATIVLSQPISRFFPLSLFPSLIIPLYSVFLSSKPYSGNSSSMRILEASQMSLYLNYKKIQWSCKQKLHCTSLKTTLYFTRNFTALHCKIHYTSLDHLLHSE